ncbi:hypothetical protein, partial [Escherichia coli]|uniref:hypothetical protein n=1 Tax=Escherichia coli TaxID=562 RepID=UPI001AA0D04E
EEQNTILKKATVDSICQCNTPFNYLFRCFEPRQPGGCKLKTAPVRPVVAARPAEYVCSEDLFY